MQHDPSKRIAACLAIPGMNRVLLAKAAGVNRNALIGFDTADWNPTKRTLDKLLAAADRLAKAVEQ